MRNIAELYVLSCKKIEMKLGKSDAAAISLRTVTNYYRR